MIKFLPYFQLIEQVLFTLIQQKNLYPERKTGRPRANLQKIFRGILFLLLRGGSWTQYDRRYGNPKTAHRYFLEWARHGLFEETWVILTQTTIAAFGCDTHIQIVDASEKCVKNLTSNAASIGYKHKGKSALKITLLVTAQGIPVAIDICGAKGSDVKRLSHALNNRIIEGSRSSPGVLLADKGYVGGSEIAGNSNLILIRPKKVNEINHHPKPISLLLKKRGKVETVFQKLYRFGRVDRIFDKKLSSFMSWCFLAMNLICLTAVLPLNEF